MGRCSAGGNAAAKPETAAPKAEVGADIEIVIEGKGSLGVALVQCALPSPPPQHDWTHAAPARAGPLHPVPKMHATCGIWADCIDRVYHVLAPAP